MKLKNMFAAIAALLPLCACAEILLLREELTPDMAAARQRDLDMLRKRYTGFTDTVYYRSSDPADYMKLSAAAHSGAVSNTLAELNKIRHSLPFTHGTDDALYESQWHQRVRRVRALKNELFDLGSVPVWLSGKDMWVDGMVLATNGFTVPDRIRSALVALNWYEQNENPHHVPVFGKAAVVVAKSEDFEGCLRHIYHNSRHIVRFDRNFNLWRLSEPLEFDADGNLTTKFDRDGNIIKPTQK